MEKIVFTWQDWKTMVLHRDLRLNSSLVFSWFLAREWAKHDQLAMCIEVALMFLVLCTARLDSGLPRWEHLPKVQMLKKIQGWFMVPLTYFAFIVLAASIALYIYVKFVL